jgi:hypothetical protein
VCALGHNERSELNVGQNPAVYPAVANGSDGISATVVESYIVTVETGLVANKRTDGGAGAPQPAGATEPVADCMVADCGATGGGGGVPLPQPTIKAAPSAAKLARQRFIVLSLLQSV